MQKTQAKRRKRSLLLHGGGSGKNEAKGESKGGAESADAVLKSFRQSFSSCTSENVGRLVNETLNLYLKPEVDLKINKEGYFALLDLELNTNHFEIYFARQQDKP